MLLNYLLAALTGVLLVLIHPRWDLTLLAPFAITGLVFALAREYVPKHRFLLGYTAGLIYWTGINYWIHFVISVHGGLGEGLGFLGFVLFVFLRAIPMGLFGLLAGVLVRQPTAALGVPALWVAMEWTPWLFNYTWLLLGNAGVEMGLPARLAPITGVYGLSYVFAALGTAVALVALRRPRRDLWWLTPLLAVAILPSLPEPSKPRASAVSIQPNIPERDDWTEQLARQTQAQMEALSIGSALHPAAPRPTLILWPEVPAPVYYFEDSPFRDRVNALARTTGAHVLIGTVARNDRGAPLNAAAMISSQGQVVGRYDKMFPVPFGEYIPFPFKGLVSKITSEVGDFEPGTRVVIFDAPPERVGAFICYESAFPGLVRRFTAAGATVLANLSNDGYFGGSAAREQHLSLVRMRAAENGRWILRSTNDGITASIDPAGRVVASLPGLIPTAGRLPYAPLHTEGLYVRLGDWFAWLCCGIAALLLVSRWVPSLKSPASPRGHE